ncbi:MAG TPA: tetratricopeptide repeat protein [Candidatus Limnocylindrales bacterium]
MNASVLIRPNRLHIRPIGLLVAAVAVAAATYGLGALRASRPATVPIVDGAALIEAAPPADLAAIDTQIAIWGPKSAADARDDISAGNLGILYLGRGRLTGDAADYERALAAADRAVAANPTSTGTRALRATVLQATHDFPGALALAIGILANEPANVDALAVAGDARLELGRLDEAATTYAAISRILPGPALDARLARLAWLRGDGTGALDLARRARDGAVTVESADPSFYEAQLGEIARVTGHGDMAAASFDAALALRPTNQLALLGRARLQAFAGDDAAAIATLRHAAAIAPRPETLALLVDILDHTGDADGARRNADTIRVIEQLGGTSAQLFDRQILGFELDHGGATTAVLDRARAAATIRPDAAGLDLVAWAAYRLGDLSAAREASDRALATGSADARILYHAGAIALARGDGDAGRALVRRALDLGPALDPVDRAAAEALVAG